MHGHSTVCLYLKLIHVSERVTKEETRFLELWKEQREGSKVGYYVLYTISWGMVSTFAVFFALMSLGGISIIPIAQDNMKILLIALAGIVAGFLITLLIRVRNEKKYQRILKKLEKNRVSQTEN